MGHFVPGWWKTRFSKTFLTETLRSSFFLNWIHRIKKPQCVIGHVWHLKGTREFNTLNGLLSTYLWPSGVWIHVFYWTHFKCLIFWYICTFSACHFLSEWADVQWGQGSTTSNTSGGLKTHWRWMVWRWRWRWRWRPHWTELSHTQTHTNSNTNTNVCVIDTDVGSAADGSILNDQYSDKCSS